MINSVLTQAAWEAARQMAVLYPDDPTISQSRISQNILVYDSFRQSGILQASEQFDDAIFDTVADPPNVKVTVHYTGGQYGLQPFPFFDPLKLGSNMQLAGTAVYRLEQN